MCTLSHEISPKSDDFFLLTIRRAEGRPVQRSALPHWHLALAEMKPSSGVCLLKTVVSRELEKWLSPGSFLGEEKGP